MKDRFVVITGAGGGLGFALTRRNLEQGVHVMAMDCRISDALRSLGDSYNSLLRILACDVASQEDVEQAGREFGQWSGRVDVIYNVAGIFRFEDKTGLAGTDLDAALAAKMFNINSMGPLRVCRAMWNYIHDGTVILNISSEAGSIANCWRKGEYLYCMSKAALNMGARLLANEMEGRQVRVINVHPGWMKTAMGGVDAMNSPSAITPEESAEDILKIVSKAFEFPKDVMYMEHDQKPLPW